MRLSVLSRREGRKGKTHVDVDLVNALGKSTVLDEGAEPEEEEDGSSLWEETVSEEQKKNQKNLKLASQTRKNDSAASAPAAAPPNGHTLNTRTRR
jgi:hypothetical protein